MTDKTLCNPNTMDQTYVHKMQYMSLNGSGANSSEVESPYGRIIGKGDANFHQKQRSMGAIESFAVEGTVPAPQKPVADYKMYERNNIIAASKFATPKQVETIASSQKPDESPGGYNGNDIYVQCAKPQLRGPSPTQSLSGSSQHSNSPRTSIANYDYSPSKNQPVYENIDYYGNRSVPPYYHQLPRNVEGTYESSYRKAQPQVPIGNRQNFPKDMECPPVYENLQEIASRSSGAQPGPQVPQGQAPPPPYSNKAPSYQTSPYNSPQHIPQQVPQQYTQSIPRNTKPYYHQSPNHGPKSPNHAPMSPSTKSLSQQQLEEINGSDYVCMTGNVAHQTLSTNIPFQTSLSTSYAHGATSGIAGAPKTPPKEDPSSPISRSPSPTPSTASTASGKLKAMSGKTLLPYNVTPPRPRGPTEAERKIEEMTRQLEEEMEKQEEEGEYFGTFLKNFLCLPKSFSFL